jgi:hypothetical protein
MAGVGRNLPSARYTGFRSDRMESGAGPEARPAFRHRTGDRVVNELAECSASQSAGFSAGSAGLLRGDVQGRQTCCDDRNKPAVHFLLIELNW